MTEAKAELSPDQTLAARIGAHAHLESARLLNVTAALVATQAVEGDFNTTSEVAIAVQRQEEGFAFAYKLQANTVAPDNDDHPVFRFEGAMELRYSILEASCYADEEVLAFGSTTGIFAAWPYLRELLSSTSQRCGLIPIVLDVFRLPIEGENTGPSGSEDR